MGDQIMEKSNTLNLQLFAEGGADGTSAGTTGANVPTGTNTEGMGEKAKDATSNKRAKNNLSDVVYGKSDNQSDAETSNNETHDDTTRPSYEDLIKGDYKKEHEEYFQKIFNARHAQMKSEMENQSSQIKAMNTVLDRLSAKYGVDAKNYDDLLKAIDADDAYYEQEANEKGITVEQLKNLKRVEHENTVLRRQMEETQRQEDVNRQIQGWVAEGEALKATYPNFDFSIESENKDFRDLVTRGIPVKLAYEIIHKDEIMSGVMQYTAQQIAEKVSNNIQSRSNRPAEAGMRQNSGIVTKSDVHALTRADRQEIARRVERGERISF